MNPHDFAVEMNIWQEIPLAGTETEAGKIRIHADFPDPEGLLDTAYSFLKRLKAPEMDVTTKLCSTSVFEEYVIRLAPGECTVSANDTEGIRRGLYKIAEILREKTPAEFPEKEERFTPFLKNRISRYRFGSETYPGTRYELDEDADAYPEPFLDRYASEGINVVWIDMLMLKNISLTKWHPDSEEEKKRKYRKLHQIIERCRRYGIRVFLYLVVPEGFDPNDPLMKEYPDMGGPILYGRQNLCPIFTGRQYLYDSFHQIFSDNPGLGGFMIIVEGEGAALCHNVEESGGKRCRERCNLSIGEVFAKELETIYRGIRDASPEADLIAWFYLPFFFRLSHYHEDILKNAPEGIIFQFNVESGSKPVQLGKPRPIGDYWLSISTPSPFYQEFAALARKYDRRLSGKIMVGASHEVSSIPYVPVPALLWRKYKALHELGTTDVMQSWMAGGTPGMMNFTAGRLAFTDFSKMTEDQFLLLLAQTLWGANRAAQVAQAWKILSDSYEQYYPNSHMIQYYGPAADGVNWPLYAYPAHKTLIRTWGGQWTREGDTVSGDNVCECLNNHTLDEVVLLFERLASEWQKGLALFCDLPEKEDLTEEQRREIIRLEALTLQFTNSWHIMRFYQLRRLVFSSEENRAEHIAEMCEIAQKELTLRKRMIELIAEEPVLGYNPEAQGFKYCKGSIESGIAAFARTFEELEQMQNGKLEQTEQIASYIMDGSPVKLEKLQWSAIQKNDSIEISVECPGADPLLDELFFAFDNDGKDYPVHGHFDITGRIFIKPEQTEIEIVKQEDAWSARITIPIHELPGGSLDCCRFNISRLIRNYEKIYSWPGFQKGTPITHIGLAFYHPGDMGFLYGSEEA